MLAPLTLDEFGIIGVTSVDKLACAILKHSHIHIIYLSVDADAHLVSLLTQKGHFLYFVSNLNFQGLSPRPPP